MFQPSYESLQPDYQCGIMSCVVVVDIQMGTSQIQYKERPRCRKFLESSYSTGQESRCLQVCCCCCYCCCVRAVIRDAVKQKYFFFAGRRFWCHLQFTMHNTDFNAFSLVIHFVHITPAVLCFYFSILPTDLLQNKQFSQSLNKNHYSQQHISLRLFTNKNHYFQQRISLRLFTNKFTL